MARVRAEAFSKTSLRLFFLASVFLTALFVAIGAFGPPLFVDVSSAADRAVTCSTANCTANWSGIVTDVSALNQWLTIIARPRNQVSADFDFKQSYVVQATGVSDDGTGTVLALAERNSRSVTCHAREEYCTGVPVFFQSFIHYVAYDFVVQLEMPSAELTAQGIPALAYDFEVEVVSKEYTLYQLAWTYAFLAGTLFVAAQFVYNMHMNSDSGPTYEQSWCYVLLVLLIGFNNPLLAAAVYSPSLSYTYFGVVLLVAFVCGIILFWLCTLDIVRTVGGGLMDPSQRGVAWYLAKAGPIAVLFLATVVAYAVARVKTTEDPTLALSDLEGYTEFRAFVFVTTACITVYVVVLAISASCQLKTMPMGHRYLFYANMFAVAVFLAALFAGVYALEQTDAVLFISLTGTANLYVWMLALAYTPVKDWEVLEGEDDAAGMIAMQVVESRTVTPDKGDEDVESKSAAGCSPAGDVDSDVVTIDLGSLLHGAHRAVENPPSSSPPSLGPGRLAVEQAPPAGATVEAAPADDAVFGAVNTGTPQPV